MSLYRSLSKARSGVIVQDGWRPCGCLSPPPSSYSPLAAASGWSVKVWHATGEAPDIRLVQHAMGPHVVYLSEGCHAVKVKAAEEKHLVAGLSNV
jgi:hypothetical protein